MQSEIQATQQAAEAAAETAQAAAQDAAATGQETVAAVQTEAQDAASTAQAATQDAAASAQEASQAAATAAQTAAQDAAATAQDAAAAAQEAAQAAATSTQAAVQDAAAAAQTAAQDAAAAAQDVAASAQEAAQTTAAAAQATAQEAAATAQAAAQDAAAAAQEAVQQAATVAQETVAAAQEAAQEAAAAAQEAVQEAATAAQATAQEALETAQAAVQQAAAVAQDAAAMAVETAQGVAAAIQEAAQDALEAAKDAAEQAQAAAQEAAAAATEAVQNVADAVQDAVDAVQAAAERAQQAAQQAVAAAAETAQDVVGAVTDVLGDVLPPLPGSGPGAAAPTYLFTPQCMVKIGGRDMPEEFMDALVEVVVDTSLHMPDMFTVVLHDSRLEWVDSSLLDVGKGVEIKFKTSAEQGAQEGVLIKGEITALEPDFSAEGRTTLSIRGYDKSHRLHRGRQTRTFTKQSDSQIVQKIAGEAELSAQIDGTNITYDYVLQNNQTNMEFLLTRAERIGYQVYVVEEELHFKKGESSQRGGPTLDFGETLLSFRPCLAATHQADKIVVKGWDAKGKQTITAEATPGSGLNQGGMDKTGGDTAKGAFGAAEVVVVNQPVFTVDEAQALATGLSNDIGREFIQAEGRCIGDPRVKAGWEITIEGVGDRFSGKYFVTRAAHVYNQQGYETTFGISGRQPNTLGHMLNSGNGHDDQARGLMQGVVTALVTNLNDPDQLGRVKVKYDWLGNIESDWVRLASPMAGAGRGFYYLPEVNDEVLLAFEHGDVHHPFIVGMLWNSKDKPPKPNDQVVGNGKVNERILMSRSGHVIVLDDTDGQENIIIRDKTGKNEIVIDSKTNSMTIKVDGDFTVEAKGKITLNSTQDMTLDSKANSNIKAGSNLAVEAQANSSIKGIQLTLEGTAKGTLKAPTVSVEGSAMTEVKGALVKIN